MIEQFTIASLAVFAIVRLIRYTDGPFDVFLHWRKLMGIQYTEVYEGDGLLVDIVEELPEGFTAKLASCHWCLSTWISLVVTLILGFSWLQWFAMIGLAGFMFEVLDGKTK